MSEEVNEMKRLVMQFNELSLQRQDVVDTLWELDRQNMELRIELAALAMKLEHKLRDDTRRKRL